MKVCGIICEYNPFHNGHAYQISTLRNTLGFEGIVCVMSGDFTQRAECAFQQKSVRAENAVKNGADLVFELPFPYCCRSAQGFASAGIKILASSGTCSHFAFGSECGNLEILSDLARILDEKLFERVRLIQKEKPDRSLIQLMTEYIKNAYGQEYADILKKPNDKLAIEYLRANSKLEHPMIPVVIKRTLERTEFDEVYASSSHIRSAVCDCIDKGMEIPAEIKNLMPQNVCLDKMLGITDEFYKTMLITLSLSKSETLFGTEEMPDNFEKVIIESASRSESYQELCTVLSGKTFTSAKIRRMLLFAFFGVKSKFFEKDPAYTNVLAYSDTGRAILANTRKTRSIIATNRVSAIHKDKVASNQFAVMQKAEIVLHKCCEYR